MFGAYDIETDEIIAIHDSRKVVDKYVSNLYKSTGKIARVRKLTKTEKKCRMYDDLYLVRFGDTYIQSKYSEYIEICAPMENLTDLNFAYDILMRILETRDLSSSDRKRIEKCSLVLYKLIKEDNMYTPDLSTLNSMKTDVEKFIYSMGGYD